MMMEKVLSKIKNLGAYYFFRNVYYWIIDFLFDLGRQYRKSISNKSYETLSNLKGAYSNKNSRCFIVATGPSLTVADLDKIEGEYSFACNSIVSAYDYTKWRPTFYGIQDKGVYRKHRDLIKPEDYEYIFFSNLIRDKVIDNSIVRYPLNLLGHTVALFRNDYDSIKYGFSDNCALEVIDGFSVTYSLFQIAIYMGFKEIYFLGQDCNYSSDPEKQHFMGGKTSQKYNPHWQQTGKLICNAFEASKRYCEENGIKVYNATRGGMFDVFPRIALEEVLVKKE